LLVLGVMIALPLVGVDLTLLSVFGSALGVGLGFGLQKIASNYVSGFIVLLDRSVRLGDMITVDNRYGEVTKLTTRYVVLRALDGTESLIPNESFIANTVINHSYSNRQALLSMPFQVSYDTDLHALLAAMESVALTNARVMPQPPPRALVKEFADSGINLQLNVWLSDPESGLGNLRSELNLAIWDYFKANGIEIPFPQREVRVLPGASEWSATK
jgi:small-conductance mechanosensitive channel